jgi:hypothetical protein
MDRFGLGEGINAPFRPATGSVFYHGMAGSAALPVLRPDQASALQAWFKKTSLKGGLPAAFVSAMSASDVDWNVVAYLNKIKPSKSEKDEKVGDVWKGRLAYIRPVIGTLASNFIVDKLGYSRNSLEFSRLYFRLGEATALASFLNNDGGIAFYPDESARKKTFDGSKMLSYGFFENNTVNNNEGATFKTSFGAPPNASKAYSVNGIESQIGSTKGNYYKVISWALANVYHLYTIIREIDELTSLTPRQRAATLISQFNKTLPGHFGLSNGQKLYSSRITLPQGASNSVRLDVEPRYQNVGQIPTVAESSGWASLLEFLIQTALVSAVVKSDRDNPNATLPTGGVPIEYRGGPAARSAAVQQADARLAEATAAAEAAEAARQELGQKIEESKKATSGSRAKAFVGLAAAAAGAYYMNKQGVV